MTINTIFSVPAATDPLTLPEVFAEAGYRCDIPPSGVLPSSKQSGGRSLVHCCISGATYDQIQAVVADQRPTFVILAAQDAFPTPNPDYDPNNPESEPTRVVQYEWNNAVWNFLPDQPVFDGDGNQTGTRQQTAVHKYQGHADWPTR